MKGFSVLLETTFAISTVRRNIAINAFNFEFQCFLNIIFGKVGMVFKPTRCTFAPIYLKEIHKNHQSINLAWLEILTFPQDIIHSGIYFPGRKFSKVFFHQGNDSTINPPRRKFSQNTLLPGLYLPVI